VSFGTRHTASSRTNLLRGIGAATNWVCGQMQGFAAASGGNMTVQQQSFVQPVSSRIPVPTTITNVIATLQGTTTPARYYVVTGHLDSRVTDVLDFTSDAPGADDDGSGVAVMLELARVFATVAGEEQGLYGSSFIAAQMAAAGNDVQGMFSNDIVGASHSFDGHPPDPHTLRLFIEGVPTAATASQISLIQTVGGENFDHEHQNTQVVGGVQFGDLIDFVDFDYTARVAAVNAATMWALATNPGTPKGVLIQTTPPGTLSGTNLTTLSWNANPESNIARYEVVTRETTAADWTNAIDAGSFTAVTLDISAVDTAGRRSPAVFPQVAA